MIGPRMNAPQTLTAGHHRAIGPDRTDRTAGRLSPLRRWLAAATLALGTLAAPAAVSAQDENPTDGRLEGYQNPVTVDNDSTALTWLLFVFLGIVGLSVLVKDAKRTHLD